MDLTNLKMPKLHIHCKVEKNGIILHDNYQIGHSWTRNAYHAYHLTMLDSLVMADMLCRDTAGATYLTSSQPPSRLTNAFAAYGYYNNGNNLNFGIVVGIGDTAFHLDDFRLETSVAHGNSADKLYYQVQVAPVSSWVGDPDYEGNILHKRVFNNNSGGSITIKEIGLISYAHIGYLLMSRDVLDVPVAVANGAQLTVTVSITTQSLSGIASGAPALGALGSGGIYIGQFNYTYAQQPPGSHGKYGLILAPLTDGATAGQSSALGYRSTYVSTAGASDSYYGPTNTAALVALGATSPIGQFVTTANSGSLGGFTDWYIPACSESEVVYTNRASIPAGEECDNAYYWTSTANGYQAYGRNPITNSESGALACNTAYKTRLIRRILISEWDPD